MPCVIYAVRKPSKLCDLVNRKRTQIPRYLGYVYVTQNSKRELLLNSRFQLTSWIVGQILHFDAEDAFVDEYITTMLLQQVPSFSSNCEYHSVSSSESDVFSSLSSPPQFVADDFARIRRQISWHLATVGFRAEDPVTFFPLSQRFLLVVKCLFKSWSSLSSNSPETSLYRVATSCHYIAPSGRMAFITLMSKSFL